MLEDGRTASLVAGRWESGIRHSVAELRAMGPAADWLAKKFLRDAQGVLSSRPEISPVVSPASNAPLGERSATSSEDRSTTGKEIRWDKLSLIKPAPADHPIYEYGFVLGQTRSSEPPVKGPPLSEGEQPLKQKSGRVKPTSIRSATAEEIQSLADWNVTTGGLHRSPSEPSKAAGSPGPSSMRRSPHSMKAWGKRVAANIVANLNRDDGGQEPRHNEPIVYEPTRFQRLVSAYNKRFNSKLPVSAVRGKDPADAEAKMQQALNEGKPNPDWEKQLEYARSLPPEERSLQHQIDAAPLPDDCLDVTTKQELPAVREPAGKNYLEDSSKAKGQEIKSPVDPEDVFSKKEIRRLLRWISLYESPFKWATVAATIFLFGAVVLIVAAVQIGLYLPGINGGIAYELFVVVGVAGIAAALFIPLHGESVFRQYDRLYFQRSGISEIEYLRWLEQEVGRQALLRFARMPDGEGVTAFQFPDDQQPKAFRAFAAEYLRKWLAEEDRLRFKAYVARRFGDVPIPLKPR